MTKTMIWIKMALVLALVTSGCTKSVSNIRMASTYNVDLTKQYTLVASDVGSTSSTIFVLFFLSGEDVDYYKALGQCLADHDGDIMTDVEVTTSSFYFGFGFYLDYKIKGNVWRCVEEPALGQYQPDELYDLRIVDGVRYLASQNGTETHKIEVERDRG